MISLNPIWPLNGTSYASLNLRQIKTGNLAVTYLGSYELHWEVLSMDGNLAEVLMTVKNTSSIQSATRPPVIGYQSWWQNSVGRRLNNAFSTGPMSPTTQTFLWTEFIRW